ncbi:hypothetical protein IU436_27550 [Nocardia farcinica]|uniref:hypothetical protein n=2 Tax=Nocardia farcinica TaxID=37329 RepID=UPI00189532DE|nr:hypothetical protein [Nocardia farcinica]MBF6422397.1 hypothetical protein [Nocardia farcinica]MBF6434098.1 hypothetical protein [Nocardia farcinica]MBF6505154.1 hypothetical protein [Nocardia farcinica]
MRDGQDPGTAFGYDYRMTCEACGDTTVLTAQTYHERQSLDARIPCSHCPASIHFGPAVAALRDPNDPTLNDQSAADTAWFHTSTAHDWPSDTHTGPSDHALHVGTYAAAVENMLRQMRNQDQANSQFYLHRVRLALTPGDIEPGYRNENHDAAARLKLIDLEDVGVLAVRYLNTHESMGSLSLAIDPAAIGDVATIALPPKLAATAPSAEVVEQLAVLDAELAAAAAARPDTTGLDTRSLRFTIPADDDELAQRVVQCDHRRRNAWIEIEALLTQTYLGTAVNPLVHDDFTQAMRGWRPNDTDPTVTEFHAHFRAHARTLTRPDDVIAQLTDAPLRQGTDIAVVCARRRSRRIDG